MPGAATIHIEAGNGFVRLVAVKPDESKSPAFWIFKCDCGNEISRNRKTVVNGNTKSCGCLKRDSTIARNKSISTTHGMSNSSEFKIWMGMIQRCTNKDSKDFRGYGARGISVCERWLSFENFFEDMGKRPDGMTLDRKDNDGNYEPGNCRWATSITQSNNRRGNKRITHNGKTQTVAEWAREIGISPKALRHRLSSGNWSVGAALSVKINHGNRWNEKRGDICAV